MTLQHLLTELRKIDKYLKKNDPESTDDIRILARLTKTQEEMGEYANEILASLDYQRQEKMNDYDKNNLSKEWSDVIITLLLQAIFLGIDVEGALEKRIKTIKKRYEIK